MQQKWLLVKLCKVFHLKYKVHCADCANCAVYSIKMQPDVADEVKLPVRRMAKSEQH